MCAILHLGVRPCRPGVIYRPLCDGLEGGAKPVDGSWGIGAKAYTNEELGAAIAAAAPIAAVR
jgi:hypothetical protein